MPYIIIRPVWGAPGVGVMVSGLSLSHFAGERIVGNGREEEGWEIAEGGVGVWYV